MKTETCELYSRDFWIFLPKIIKIDLYNSELYRFKVGAFLRHSVFTVYIAGRPMLLLFDWFVLFTCLSEYDLLLLLQSGTTGNPKGVMISHDNVSTFVYCVYCQ